MHIYIDVCVCVCVSGMYTCCMYTRVYKQSFLCGTSADAHMQFYMHIHMSTYVSIYTCTYVRMHVEVYCGLEKDL